MKKRGNILFILSLWTLLSQAQGKTEDFQISLPEEKITGSLYNSIQLLDIRNDTASLGIIQKGAFNKRVTVVAKTPLAIQFVNVVNAFTDNTAKSGELLLLLRQFNFAEVTGAMSEKGYFQFRAILFAIENGKYNKLGAIDTVVLVKS